MKVFSESGKISIWDLFIVVLVVVAVGAVYQRGMVDRFLPAEYHSLQVMAQHFPQALPKGVTAEDVKSGRATRGANNVIEVAHDTTGKREVPKVEAKPVAVVEATPAPMKVIEVEEEEAPAPAPVVEATPAPIPVQDKPFLLKDAPRSAWPKEVALKAPVDFPVVINGTTSGSMRSPAGSMVTLMEVRGEHLLVSVGPNATRLILAKETDVQERVKAALNANPNIRR